ncbi:hypothetical protein [Candidatus Nitrosarchaeum limnium]|jgi:hypothetical protein|uniref:CARDB domain-containing protein n=1 Tax=Candidatus Nitrosarchaeum limnium BG20 TaxID=859192 RepID=S2EJG5_9ARCH|nr:hypothetical protein [Candidatus Nitrosarchaeum limnium]EPA04862.1 hypothetical protein BG20_I1938 [Candidatus Nitrosarchaeum limnium BG20]
MSVKIYFFVGIVILIIATVGFGASLNTVPKVHKIGSADNIVVSKPTVDVTNTVLNTSGSNAISATVTVKNIDSVAHTYRICMIVKAGALISDTSGSGADCSNTASISASNTGSTTITFAIPRTTNNLSYWNMAVHQIA